MKKDDGAIKKDRKITKKKTDLLFFSTADFSTLKP